jgi:hypothetical protein
MITFNSFGKNKKEILVAYYKDELGSVLDKMNNKDLQELVLRRIPIIIYNIQGDT